MTVSLVTTEDLAPVLAALQTLLARQDAPAPVGEDYLPLDQVAALTYTSVSTVKKWVREGKYDASGKLLKLFALEFSPGYLRIPRSALLAFGQAQGFDAAQLHRAAGPAPARKAPAVLDSAKALRKAS